MIRKSRVLALAAAALAGGLLTTAAASPAWADTLCAKAVGVTANLSPGQGTYVLMGSNSLWVAGVSLNDQLASMGIVVEAWQPSNGTYVTLYNSNSTLQQIHGWAIVTYRC